MRYISETITDMKKDTARHLKHFRARRCARKFGKNVRIVVKSRKNLEKIQKTDASVNFFPIFAHHTSKTKAKPTSSGHLNLTKLSQLIRGKLKLERNLTFPKVN